MTTGTEIFASILAHEAAGTFFDHAEPVDQDEVEAGEYKAGDKHWMANDGHHQTIIHADGRGWISDSNGDFWEFDIEAETLTPFRV